MASRPGDEPPHPMTSERDDRERPSTVALVDVYNGGNLGDRSSQEATIRYYAAREPRIESVLFSAWPRMTEAIHEVPSYMLSPGAGGSHYYSNLDPARSTCEPDVGAGGSGSGGSEGGAESSGGEGGAAGAWRARAKAALGRVPWIYAFAKRIRNGAARIRWEVKHTVDTARVLRDVDAVFINGGGQFNDEWGGPFAHPFTLAKFAALCRLTGTPLLVVSVGASELESRWSRWFIGYVLRRASYTSIRDEDSLAVLGDWHDIAGFRLRPDLAFAYRPERHIDVDFVEPYDADRRRGAVIALSPISYGKRGVWSRSDPRAFEVYRERLIEFMTRQVECGRRVRLFASSPMEWAWMDELVLDLPPEARSSVRSFSPDGFQDGMHKLLRAISGADVVVASRLHGVILSHVQGLPVVAVSHDRKVEAHMADMGALDRLVSFADAEPDRLCRLVDETLEDRHRIVEEVTASVAERAALVEDQYEEIAARFGL